MRKCTILWKFWTHFDGCSMSQKLGTGPFLTLCSTAASCNNKDSQNMLMILCTVDQIFKVFIVLCLETLFWNYSTTCRHSLLQISESLPILTSEKLCLSLVTDLLPINTFNCKIWLQLFLFSTTEFLKPTSQLFLSRLAAIKNTKTSKNVLV